MTMTQEQQTTTYVCDRCNRELPLYTDNGMFGNYGINAEGIKHCYRCCAEIDLEYMREHGRISLYLTRERIKPGEVVDGAFAWQITNWPGSLRFKLQYPVKFGKHNMAGRRYDVWFRGPDNCLWHGVSYGDNTDMLHAKRTKETYPGQTMIEITEGYKGVS